MSAAVADADRLSKPAGPLLQVRGLIVSIGGRKAVDGLGFSLGHGETLGIVGESGCGKTLSVLALIGLEPPQARTDGTVLFEGRNLLAMPRRQLRALRGDRIAMIFQEPMTALNPVQTIAEQVGEMFVLHHGLSRRQASTAALDALARVHIGDAYRCGCDYPHQLSGGQRQRVMIAMALACGPQLLIADEPTTALDVTVQAQILDLIFEMQQELNMSVLFISHNLGVISQVADRVMVMYAGKAVELAASDVLLHEPLHPYTQALLKTLPRIGRRRARLPTIPGQVPAPGALPPGCRFAQRCELAVPACREREPALEDHGHHDAPHQVRCLRVAESSARLRRGEPSEALDIPEAVVPDSLDGIR